jgi:hypothetical protein
MLWALSTTGDMLIEMGSFPTRKKATSLDSDEQRDFRRVREKKKGSSLEILHLLLQQGMKLSGWKELQEPPIQRVFILDWTWMFVNSSAPTIFSVPIATTMLRP